MQSSKGGYGGLNVQVQTLGSCSNFNTTNGLAKENKKAHINFGLCQ